MAQPILRSFLFAPASSDRKMLKALQSAADGVVIDLEDSVALSQKGEARAAAAAVLSAVRRPATFVRVNAAATTWWSDDVEAIAALVAGVMLPKVEAINDLLATDALLSKLEVQHSLPHGLIEIMPIIETARGLVAVYDIAASCKRVRQIALGAVDLALDMDVDMQNEDGLLAHARYGVALASRAAGLRGPIDSAFVDFGNPEDLRASASRARAFGYQGKCCIHPSQIETINSVFSPTRSEVDKARQIVAAFDAAERKGEAALAIAGGMVDYPVAEKARRLLEIAERIAASAHKGCSANPMDAQVPSG